MWCGSCSRVCGDTVRGVVACSALLVACALNGPAVADAVHDAPLPLGRTQAEAWRLAQELAGQAALLREQGRHEAAMAKAVEALAVHDSHETAWWELGHGHFLMGDYQRALEIYQQARFTMGCGLAHAQHAYRRHYHQGLCYEYMGRTDEAVFAYIEAIFVPMLRHRPQQAHYRIVDLYEQADELETLLELLTLYEPAGEEVGSRGEPSPAVLLGDIISRRSHGSAGRWEGRQGVAYPPVRVDRGKLPMTLTRLGLDDLRIDDPIARPVSRWAIGVLLLLAGVIVTACVYLRRRGLIRH